MDCSLPGSSIHGIFQARVLEWGAITWGSTKPNLRHAAIINSQFLWHRMQLSIFTFSPLSDPLTVEVSSDWCLPFHLFLFGSQSSLLHSELPEDKSFVLFLRVKQALASTRLPFLQPLFWLGQHYSSQSLFWGKPLLLQPSTTIPLSFGDTNHVILVTVTSLTWDTQHGQRGPHSPSQTKYNTQTKLTKVCPWDYPVWNWNRRSLAS